MLYFRGYTDPFKLGQCLRRKKLTWRGKFQREVSKQPLSSNVRNCAENNDGPGEPGVTEPDPLVRGELRHRFAPHKVFPMVLKNCQLIPQQQYKIFLV